MERHRIIFLDIDGVLNSFPVHQGYEHNPFDNRKMDELERLVEMSGAKIVISSDHRFKCGVIDDDASMKYLKSVFTRCGYSWASDHIIDVTPLDVEHRVYAIKQWLSDNRGKYMSWCAIDDSKDIVSLPFHVRTDNTQGLTWLDSRDVVSILYCQETGVSR